MVEHARAIVNSNKIKLQMEYITNYCLLIYSTFFIMEYISAPKYHSKMQIAPKDKACLTFL